MGEHDSQNPSDTTVDALPALGMIGLDEEAQLRASERVSQAMPASASAPSAAWELRPGCRSGAAIIRARQGLVPALVERDAVDWQAGLSGIDGLREIVQSNSRAAAQEADLARGARVRVSAVQEMLLASPEPAVTWPASTAARAAEVPDAPAPPAAEVPDALAPPPEHGQAPGTRRPGGVARLREGPLADLFRATDARPGSA